MQPTNHLSPDMTSEEVQRLKLEQQLNEAAIAERWIESATGKLWTEMATDEITRLTREVVSDKYRKDPTGYNIAVSDIQAYKKILRKMQVAASPARSAKIRELLGEE